MSKLTTTAQILFSSVVIVLLVKRCANPARESIVERKDF